MNGLEQMSPESVGERLRIAREKANFTQEDAAKAIDVARTTLVAIEQGRGARALARCRNSQKPMAPR